MGNGIGKLCFCFTGDPRRHHHHDNYLYQPDPTDDSVGHSFYYLRSDPTRHHPPPTSDDPSTLFRSISGASLSANTSTIPLSLDPTTSLSGPLFETSTSFASAPLHPVPRSGPLSGPDGDRGFLSGPMDRTGPGYSGFVSGPVGDRGFLSGPMERAGMGYSGPMGRSYSYGTGKRRRAGFHGSMVRGIRRVISRTFGNNSVVTPIAGIGSDPNETSWERKERRVEEMEWIERENNVVEWAQGRAGEDRVHVAVSEEHGWVFVGIYDGFSGPDATDFLLSNLYTFVEEELKGLLWDDEEEDGNDLVKSQLKSKSTSTSIFESLERLQIDDQRLIDDGEVLRALSGALHKTEEAYFELSNKMIDENAELAMMGSCVLVMLMKGEDVYVMNVGDSRALLAKTKDIDHDLKRINEEPLVDFPVFDGVKPSLLTFQLTMDHSTCVEEEVQRIRDEHRDDPLAIMNDRVKGTLKVTRAFGAGFLKQPKWNNALLEMFRIDYVGTSPYLNCLPSLCHHRLGLRDQFLILSSDGLYQYFTNEEAIAEVELFICMSPDGDPAQHLVEEVLLRAAKKAGMDFYELLEIPQGDRRKYHDDVSIIIISFEGRIWRSCV